MTSFVVQARSLPLGPSHPITIVAERVLAVFEAAAPGGGPSVEGIIVMDDGSRVRVAAPVGDIASAVEVESAVEMASANLSPLGLGSARVVDGVVAGQISSLAAAESVDAHAGVRWHRLGSGRIAEVIA
jgi:hypothetical protein